MAATSPLVTAMPEVLLGNGEKPGACQIWGCWISQGSPGKEDARVQGQPGVPAWA